MFKHLSKFSNFILENNANDILKNVMSVENIAKKHNIDIKILQKYLQIGTRIEREHNENNDIAEKITLKHLEENPMYYQQKFGLPEIEKRMKKIEQEKRLEQDIIDQQKIDQDIIETNESIRQFLKPKSEENILKSLEHLSDDEKFEKSCKYGLTSVVKNLIDNGFDPSHHDNYGIKIASLKGNLDVVKELLKDERVDPSCDNNYAINLSIEKGHLDVVKELLKDKRVISKLSEEGLKYYKNQIKK